MWHMQKTVPNWTDSIYILPDQSMFKATGGYEVFAEVKAINPKIYTVHRMVRGEWQLYSGQPTSGWFDWDVARDLARDWFDGFVDGTFKEKIARHTDAVSWHNEEWADSQNSTERAERVAATEAAVWVWNREYRPLFANDIQLIIGEAAPGNSMPREIASLAIESDNVVGYHPYEWWTEKVRSDIDWRYHTSLRFDLMEDEWDLYPQWAFTECGPLESAVTGWRHNKCLSGDESLYIEAVRLWMRDVAKTAAYKQGRIKGFSLFTTFSPNDGSWGSFHTEQPTMNKLAKAIAEEWNPGDEEITLPGPFPWPNYGFQQHAWDRTAEMQITGQGGLRLNPGTAIQAAINQDNQAGLHLQIVTDEVVVDGYVVQAAESLTGAVPRRVYVWEAGKPVWHFEEG